MWEEDIMARLAGVKGVTKEDTMERKMEALYEKEKETYRMCGPYTRESFDGVKKVEKEEMFDEFEMSGQGVGEEVGERCNNCSELMRLMDDGVMECPSYERKK